MRPILFAFLIFASLTARAATALYSDASDMWWNSSESGWGVNLAQQANVLFATLYVYSADGRAHWYVAPDMETQPVPSDRPQVFQGALYETTGPVFTGAFDPNAVTRRVVGTATFEYVLPANGTLTYTVDGATVTKSVRRQTWRDNDASGQYYATLVTRSSNCSQPASGRNLGTLAVTQSGASFSMTTSADACTYGGNYLQQGRMGSSSGTFTCPGSQGGSYSLSEIEAGTHGFVARFDGTVGACRVYGHLAATRATVPEAAQ